jgi:hypothetical protein
MSDVAVVYTSLAALVTISLVAVGCGGSPWSNVAATTTPATSDKYAASLAYSECMRSHGLPNFPDPKEVGDGIQVSGSRSGVDPTSPVFISALQSCRHLLPGGGRSTNTDQQRGLARMLRISQCIRAHGISGFLDPTLSAPRDRSGYVVTVSDGVASLAIPNAIDVRSPAFKRAAPACKLELS